MEVKDYGIGIKDTDLIKIFDRFYRVDESRGRGGYGLGLSIVKAIGNIHRFEISIKSEFGKYTEIKIGNLIPTL